MKGSLAIVCGLAAAVAQSVSGHGIDGGNNAQHHRAIARRHAAILADGRTPHVELALRSSDGLDDDDEDILEEKRAINALAHRGIAIEGKEVTGNASHTLDKRYGGCHATYYNAETGNQGACGGFIKNSDYVVAVDADLYGNLGARSWLCNKRISITWGGKTVNGVRIGDACPGCPSGCGLDMTPGLFQAFTGLGTGVLDGMSWHVEGEGQPQQPQKPTTTSNTWKPPSSTWRPPTTTSTWKAPTSTWQAPTTSSRAPTTSTTPTTTSQATTSTSVAQSTSSSASNSISVSLNATVSIPGNTTSHSSGPQGTLGGDAGGAGGFLANAHQVVLNIGDLVAEAAAL